MNVFRCWIRCRSDQDSSRIPRLQGASESTTDQEGSGDNSGNRAWFPHSSATFEDAKVNT